MATEKTPTHKRIARAEKSATEWKVKAIERREELEAVKGQLAKISESTKAKDAMLDEATAKGAHLEKQLQELSEKLKHADAVIATLQSEMKESKKKASLWKGLGLLSIIFLQKSYRQPSNCSKMVSDINKRKLFSRQYLQMLIKKRLLIQLFACGQCDSGMQNCKNHYRRASGSYLAM